jgi:hypothetical protein
MPKYCALAFSCRQHPGTWPPTITEQQSKYSGRSSTVPTQSKVTTCHLPAKGRFFSFSVQLSKFMNCDDGRALLRAGVEAVGTRRYLQLSVHLSNSLQSLTIDAKVECWYGMCFFQSFIFRQILCFPIHLACSFATTLRTRSGCQYKRIIRDGHTVISNSVRRWWLVQVGTAIGLYA